MEQYEKLTDEQLIEKLHSGDRDVTDYLMEKYKMMVRKKARAMYLIGRVCGNMCTSANVHRY